MATTPSKDTAEPLVVSSHWACDSKNNELDPALQAAHEYAVEEQQQQQQKNLQKKDDESSVYCPELTEPLIIRNLLSSEQIDEILTQASAQGVWPRGVKPSTGTENGLSKELHSKAYHYAWTDNHIVLYMHNNDYWFVRTCPIPWCIIRGGMESRHGQEGIPILDPAWVGSDHSMRDVRTIELHHYSEGGGLITPGHVDHGSELTMSILLSDPDSVSGGDFVTYGSRKNDGAHDADADDDDEKPVVPIAHKMGRGDAILFNSGKLHNISTVTSGVRQSLVVELWPSKRY